MRKFAIIILVLVLTGCVAVTMALWDVTLVDSWIPLTVAGGGAIVTGMIFGKSWRVVTGSNVRAVNFGCQAVFGFALFLGAFFMVNGWMADDEKYDAKVEVTERIRETHKRTRRVGRRYVADGPEYYMYYLKVRFDDGELKKIAVNRGEYSRRKAGDSVMVEMRTGRFGYPVIRGIVTQPMK